MVSVILIWIYMTITAYLTGFGLLSLLPGIKKYSVRHADSFVYAGIVAITVYAQIFSLFGRVGLAANLVLMGSCAAVAAGFRKPLTERFRRLRGRISPMRAAVVALVFLLFAFGASRGIIHYDTGLYHAQSIRWIEEYGIVPGLGNLHIRLAYNSASFALSALYSMKFLGGQSFHAGAGFLAFWVAVVCLKGIWRRRDGEIGTDSLRKAKAGKITLADLARIMAVYYLLNIFDEMISPASDYFMVLLFFYLIIRWLDLLAEKENSYIPYALLSLLAVFLLTVKLSAALILLLALKPAVMLIREKRKAAVALFLCLGLVIVLPYLARNVILSGWPVYPGTFPDIFHPDWKLPREVAEYDFKEIQVWGRGYTEVADYHRPLGEWLPAWFAGQDRINRLFILAAAGSSVLWLLMFMDTLIRRKGERLDWLLVTGAVNACFCFWLFSAPLIRYGCVYVWLAPTLTGGYLYLRGSPRFDKYKYLFLYLALLAVGGYKAVTFGKELGNLFLQAVKSPMAESYLLRQQDYENYPTVPYQIHGYTFYYAAEGDRTGYEDFPASPGRAEDIFRGETMEEGFRWLNR